MDQIKMVNISEFEDIARSISTEKIERLASASVDCDITNISIDSLREEFGFTPSESIQINNIVRSSNKSDIFAASLRLALRINEIKDSRINKLVMTGGFYNDARPTHETIYQMINRAESSIVIVGYVIHEIQDLLKTISRCQEAKHLRVKFIMNLARKWRHQILKNWNSTYSPDILSTNKKYVKTMHAKIILIDRSEILITSANLTSSAMENNIEAGIWTKDKDIITACYNSLDDLERSGRIVPVDGAEV